MLLLLLGGRYFFSFVILFGIRLGFGASAQSSRHPLVLLLVIRSQRRHVLPELFSGIEDSSVVPNPGRAFALAALLDQSRFGPFPNLAYLPGGQVLPVSPWPWCWRFFIQDRFVNHGHAAEHRRRDRANVGPWAIISVESSGPEMPVNRPFFSTQPPLTPCGRETGSYGASGEDHAMLGAAWLSGEN